MIVVRSSSDHIADTVRFYEYLNRIEDFAGGLQTLATCDRNMDWPRRGVYFFFEKGEERSKSGKGSRVVRVGKASSGLWNRLDKHRGSLVSGGGEHRSSIFRKIVGVALARRDEYPLPDTWGIGDSPSKAASKLGIDRDMVKRIEADLEKRVSEYIKQMPFIWIKVSTAFQLEVIEKNAIALLSHAKLPAPDTPSGQWLGSFSDRKQVRKSGLWNNHHVLERYAPSFLDVMKTLINTGR